MKNKLTSAFASLLMLVFFLTSGNTFAQTTSKSGLKKECCMMKDGKMMHMKDGKTMPMETDMTMSNGTVCMVNGECVTEDGKKMMMKEGQCMDMAGKLENCSMTTTYTKRTKHTKHTKHTTKKVTRKNNMGTIYTCTMHPDVVRNSTGTCPTCGMDLVVRK